MGAIRVTGLTEVTLILCGFVVQPDFFKIEVSFFSSVLALSCCFSTHSPSFAKLYLRFHTVIYLPHAFFPAYFVISFSATSFSLPLWVLCLYSFFFLLSFHKKTPLNQTEINYIFSLLLIQTFNFTVSPQHNGCNCSYCCISQAASWPCEGRGWPAW